jgi:hypothetical protein
MMVRDSLLYYAIIVAMMVMMIVAVCVVPMLMFMFDDDWRPMVVVAQLERNARSLCDSANGYDHA